MGIEQPFTAGSFLTYAPENEPNKFFGRIYLVIEAENEQYCLDIRKDMQSNIQAWQELFGNLHPWPEGMVKFDHHALIKMTSIKNVIVANPAKES